MTRTVHTYPSDAEILKGIRQHGGVAPYARALGISAPTLRHRISRRGLSEQALAAYREAKGRVATKAAPRKLSDDVSREEVLEQENAELRKALTGARRIDVRQERVLIAIERALDRVQPPAPCEVASPGPLPAGDAHHRAMLLTSDAHGGEEVRPEAVNYLNAYDLDIMVARHDEMVAGALSHMRRMPPLTGLDIGILGDNNSGANHRELETTNQLPLAQQGIRMGYVLADHVVRPLAAHVPDVRVFSVPGNHPRLTDKPAAKDVINNMDFISTVLAEQRCGDLQNVTWTQPTGAALFWEIAGRRCYVWHGDGIRSTMPGVPWGGVMRRTNEIQRQHARHIDHFIFGHFHQANVVQGGRVIGNGSLKGVDEWSIKSFGGGDPPTQLLLVFDERAQRLTDVRYLTPTAGLS